MNIQTIAKLRRIKRILKRIVMEVSIDLKARELKKALHMIRSLFSHIVFGTPYSIAIEVTNKCNLRCLLCSTPPWHLQRPGNRLMNFEEFKKIIDEIKLFTHYVFLYFVGEPLLHPQISQMISYATRNHLHCEISSNLNLLDRSLAKEIIRSRLDKLIIAIDGATKETYERMKTGGNFEKLIENIKTMVEEKKNLKAIKPILEMQIIVSKINEHELGSFRGLAKTLGVDKYSIKTLCIPETLFPKEKLNTLKKEYLPESGPSRYQEGTINQPNICRLANKANITTTGDLAVCCYEFNAKYIIGNAFKHSFKELWESNRYRKIREKMKRRELSVCQTCPDSDIKYLE